jgi:dihydrofolate reductase
MENKPQVFIITAITADGYIAHDKNEMAMWTSKEDKNRFVALTKDAGVMVMGATTFKTFPKPLPGRHHVIYSRSERFEDKWPDGNVETTTLPPEDLIKSLVDRGYTKIAICGGERTYTKFIQAGVLTHAYLTIEPVFFGTGLRLFNGEILQDIKMKLLKTEHTESGTIFADYEIV